MDAEQREQPTPVVPKPIMQPADYRRRSLLLLLDSQDIEGAIVTEPDFARDHALGKLYCLENILRIERALWRLLMGGDPLLQSDRARELATARLRELVYYRSHRLFLGKRL